MNWRLNVLLLLTMVMLAVVPTAAGAWTIDGPAGTAITNSCTVSYGTTTVNDSVSIGADTQVAAIYGDTLEKPVEASDANMGDTILFTYAIRNTGNTTDSFYVSFSQAPIYIGGAANWVFVIGNGTDSQTYGYGGTPTPADSITVGPITEDGVASFYVVIQTSGVAAESPNGSIGGCSFSVQPFTQAMGISVPTGQYNGDNLVAYAENVPSFGTNNFGNDTVTVAAAVFAVTKDCTSTLGGAMWTPVPGASLGFRISYSNTGTGSGNNVVIYDQIDTSVIKYEEPLSTPAGWTFQIGPSDVTDFSFASGQFFADGGILDDTVRWVRWTKAAVPAAEAGELNFRTSIY